MNPFKQILKYALSAVMPAERFLTSGPSLTRDVALTFDDGPHPEHTPRLLDEFAEHQIHGTFFVVGEKARQFPGLVRRIAEAGHAVGHHSWTHSEPKDTSAEVLIEEVKRSRELLEDLTGKPSNLFRPPKGQLTWRKMRRLWELQQTIVLWNVDPRDYSLSETSQIEAWARNYAPTAGEILLFHDNHPFATAGVKRLVEKAEFRTYWKFCRITDWLPQRASLLQQPV